MLVLLVAYWCWFVGGISTLGCIPGILLYFAYIHVYIPGLKRMANNVYQAWGDADERIRNDSVSIFSRLLLTAVLHPVVYNL